MITANDILQKIKAAFLGEPAQQAAPAIPAEPTALAGTTYKTSDGIELSVAQAGDIPATGDAVTIAGVPAPDGDYVLEDGSTLSVAMGLVTVFTPGAPVTNDLEQELPALTIEQRIANIETAISRMFNPVQMEQQVKVLEETVTKHTKTITDQFDLIEMLVKEPTTEPKTLTGNAKERFDRNEKKADRFARIANQVSEIKALA